MYNNMKILVVEDEEKIMMIVKLYLEKEGYDVITATNGQKALDIYYEISPHLVILDLMLPDLSGEAICREIRKNNDTPIIMLTAKNEESSILNGLYIGADDYIVKPFSPKQLIARVKAVLRRSYKQLNEQLRFNHELSIDIDQYIAYIDGEDISLTPIEFKILLTLATHSNKVFTREEIIESVYGHDFSGYDRSIDGHIKNLRKKLKDSPPKYIKTVHGIGYRFGGEKDA